jgi:hypothetical protein
MTDTNWIQQSVEKVVGEVVESHIPQLKQDLVSRVLAALGPQLEAAPASSPADLLKAISAIQAGSTQREILRSLLDHAARYCGRAALFVVKAGKAVGWQGRAIANHEEIKDFSLDVSAGVAARAMQSRIAFQGSSSDMDAKFTAKFGTPADDRVLMLPLLLKERVAALIYADPGAEAGGSMDAAALELLVVAASAWLEVAASRKQGQKEGSAEISHKTENGSSPKAEKAHAAVASAAQTSSVHDPFASHSPQHFAAAPAAIEESPLPAGAIAVAEVESAPAPEVPPTVAAVGPTEVSAEDSEIHRKAQRFARLLVDEIKLYNQAKVSEGRKNKDLYDRLKDDIDKSLATYQKRYGSTVAASADYFSHEIIRSLAEDDTSVMGANFPR